jgi:hypothetical protein
MRIDTARPRRGPLFCVGLCACAESHPLDPKENAQVLEKIDAMRSKTLASVNATLHSITDYSSALPVCIRHFSSSPRR